MKYEIFQPSAALAPFVRFFWILEDEVSNSTSFVHRSIADGCAELIFHYKGDFVELTGQTKLPQASSMLHAQSRIFRRFETFESFGIFGVYLYPYALPFLFSMPASELSNEMPDLKMLWANEGKVLEERVMLAPNHAARCKIVSAFLEKRLLSYRFLEKNVFLAIQHLIQTKGAISIATLSDIYCMSERQLERKFKEFSGFSPKLYSRIQRFSGAIENYGNKNKSLTEIAYSCGYYDQSHFIHEFKEFSGYHPKHYFSGKPEGSDYKQL